MCVNHGLHKAAGFVDLQCTCDVTHWHGCHVNIASLLACLLLAQPDTRQLWIDEHGVGHQAPGGGARASLEQIAADNTEVVICHMGESGPTISLTERVYAGHVRLQTLVDLDEAAFVDFDPRVLEGELLDVRRAARRHQQMRSAQRPLVLAGLYVKLDLVAVTPHPERQRIEHHSDPVFAQDCGDRLGDVLVFTSKELTAALDEGDTAAKAPKHLAEFEPDVAATEHQQMLRDTS